mmetsp:Transcript_27743/g.69667  ORF Transcript_27743/g.69667 Transcript_27743/m.69667 type:complete len:474 (-) Transcript_27743:98-1519(-)
MLQLSGPSQPAAAAAAAAAPSFWPSAAATPPAAAPPPPPASVLPGSESNPPPTAGFLVPTLIIFGLLIAAGAIVLVSDAVRTHRALAAKGWQPKAERAPGMAWVAAMAAKRDEGYSLLPTSSRRFTSEFFGTFVVTLLQNGIVWTAVYQYSASPTEMNVAAGISPSPAQAVSPLFTAVSIGLTFTFTMNLFPGANLNPMFTTFLSMQGQIAWSFWAPVMLAQFMGTFLGHVFTYLMLADALKHLFEPQGLDHRNLQTAMHFGVTFPPDWVSNGASFLSSVTMGFVIIALLWPLHISMRGEERMSPFFHRLCVGLAIMVVVAAFGNNGLGTVNNPFLLLAGAVFVSAAGWPREVWTSHNNFVLYAPFMPFVGMVLGYMLCRIIEFLMLTPHKQETTAQPSVSKKDNRLGDEPSRAQLAAMLREAANTLDITVGSNGRSGSGHDSGSMSSSASTAATVTTVATAEGESLLRAAQH